MGISFMKAAIGKPALGALLFLCCFTLPAWSADARLPEETRVKLQGALEQLVTSTAFDDTSTIERLEKIVENASTFETRKRPLIQLIQYWVTADNQKKARQYSEILFSDAKAEGNREYEGIAAIFRMFSSGEDMSLIPKGLPELHDIYASKDFTYFDIYYTWAESQSRDGFAQKEALFDVTQTLKSIKSDPAFDLEAFFLSWFVANYSPTIEARTEGIEQLITTAKRQNLTFSRFVLLYNMSNYLDVFKHVEPDIYTDWGKAYYDAAKQADDPVERFFAPFQYAIILQNSGRAGEALALFSEARPHVKSQGDYWTALLNAQEAVALLKTGQADKAKKLMAQAEKYFNEHLQSGHYYLEMPNILLAYLEGDYDRGVRLLDRRLAQNWYRLFRDQQQDISAFEEMAVTANDASELAVRRANNFQILSFVLALSVLLIFFLFTKQRRTSAKLEESRQAAEKLAEEAKHANEVKSRFLANMSHEIRTPLNAIIGFSSMLNKSKNLNEEESEFIEAIETSGNHLLGLVNDVLDMSKVESGRTYMRAADFNPRSVFEDIQLMFQQKMDEKGLDYQVIVEKSMPTMAHGDKRRLRQILINLISNALKFTDSGYIRVTSKAIDKGDRYQLLCDVADTGKGIDPKDHALIFKAFEQTDEGQDEGHGTGLGLPLSRNFAREMAGNITLTSELGKGSTFHLTADLKKATQKPD